MASFLADHRSKLALRLQKTEEALKEGHQKLTRLVERLPEGLTRTEDTIRGLINPNHRHDEPLEKLHDEIRARINARHRFNSFAEQRAENFVKWHIDGYDYMWALSEMLESAQQCIFIMDWWLTPELYLRRPPAYYPEYRLDKLLKRKAEEGVKIYVVVYKNVAPTMTLNSQHTKHALEALHPNIACFRHPDHIGAQDNVEFWSHHEKVVIVDNHRACIGGLDLCFGRWDTHSHPLADVHPTDFSRTLFPGQDYNNARVLDFQQVDKFTNNALSILESPRMPWHDVHTTLAGPVVLDLAQHFIERWNEVKQRKYKSDDRYDWLALPHNVEVAPNESVVYHPHREAWHEMGRRFRQRFHLSGLWDEEEDEHVYPRPPCGTCRVQVVRSVGDWSHGVLTEHSIQNAYRQMILEANHYIYIENQFFVSNTGAHGPVKNLVAQALVERIVRAGKDGAKFKVVVVIPEVPGFAGSIRDQTALKAIMAAQYRTINRGGHSIYEEIRKAGFDPMDYIRIYHLRSYDRINAPYPSFISKMEENSGVKFHEAQAALARQWIGPPNASISENVSIKFVEPSVKDGNTGHDSNEKTKIQNIALPETEEDARTLIEKFQRGADQEREDAEVSDAVDQHMLISRTSLLDQKWLGTEEEEKNAYVSEILYIHSKLMIVDDKKVIIGSANLNDRSQLGNRDSEIALVVEDDDYVASTMDGKPYMAARFATSLRRKLYREHIGLISPQTCHDGNEPVTSFMRCAPYPNDDETGEREDAAVADPLMDSTLALWNNTARRNREIFTELFRPVPTNLVTNWNTYENYILNVKPGHLAPDVTLGRAKKLLSEVMGSLVECPLDFLRDEKSLTENADWFGLNPTLPVYL